MRFDGGNETFGPSGETCEIIYANKRRKKERSCKIENIIKTHLSIQQRVDSYQVRINAIHTLYSFQVRSAWTLKSAGLRFVPVRYTYVRKTRYVGHKRERKERSPINSFNTMLQKNSCNNCCLGCPFGRPFFLVENAIEHVTETRDRPCRPQAYDGFDLGLS